HTRGKAFQHERLGSGTAGNGYGQNSGSFLSKKPQDLNQFYPANLGFLHSRQGNPAERKFWDAP
ncbi:MAG: hypothetical protein KJT03_21750, partial [Verrucomicrobiae bacterium]|nr:hypothetical protein [Verrucomicrobiae bacterium]